MPAIRWDLISRIDVWAETVMKSHYLFIGIVLVFLLICGRISLTVLPVTEHSPQPFIRLQEQDRRSVRFVQVIQLLVTAEVLQASRNIFTEVLSI